MDRRPWLGLPHPSGGAEQQYPGSRYTWVKMGRPSIEGLRLALIDGAPLSLLRSDRTTGNPNEHSHLVIESVAASAAQYAGRVRDLLWRASARGCLLW